MPVHVLTTKHYCKDINAVVLLDLQAMNAKTINEFAFRKFVEMEVNHFFFSCDYFQRFDFHLESVKDCSNSTTKNRTCQCNTGWEGTNCETKINHCANHRCTENGVCRSLLTGYKCECVSPSYSGQYCEIVSASLSVRQTVSRSLGYVALTSISLVFACVIFLDVLKYVFKIDITQKEREEIRARKEKKTLMRKSGGRSSIVRYKHVSGSSET